MTKTHHMIHKLHGSILSIAIQSLQCSVGRGNFVFFCCCDLDLDLHVRTWLIFRQDVPVSADQKWAFDVKAFKSYCITDRRTNRHTHRCYWNYICVVISEAAACFSQFSGIFVKILV